MKRVLPFVTSLVTLFATTGLQASAPIAMPGVYDDKVFQEEPSGVRFFFGASIHYSAADSDIRNFALVTETDLTAATHLAQHNESIESGYEVDYDLLLGMELYERNGIFIRYQRWDHADDDGINIFGFRPTTSNSGTGISLDGLGVTTSGSRIIFASTAFSKIHTDYDTIELYYRHSFPLMSMFDSYLHVGIKWASIKTKKETLLGKFFAAAGNNGNLVTLVSGAGNLTENTLGTGTSPVIEATMTITDQSDFDGLGPYIGVSGRYTPFMNGFAHGFGIFGIASFSMLADSIDGNTVVARNNFPVGDFVADSDPNTPVIENINAVPLEVSDNDSTDRVVFNATVKVGIDYMLEFGNASGIRVGIGYQAEQYNNAITVNNSSNTDSDFSLRGWFGELEVII